MNVLSFPLLLKDERNLKWILKSNSDVTRFVFIIQFIQIIQKFPLLTEGRADGLSDAPHPWLNDTYSQGDV